MAVDVRADYFWFVPTSGSGEDAAKGIAAWISSNKAPFIDRDFSHNTYRLADLTWNARQGKLAGVMYKHVASNLPSTLSITGAEPVRIEDDESLGAPVCFCYYPKLCAAIIQFNQMGARHKTLRQFLTAIGAPHAIHTAPILKDDAIARLRDTKIIRSFEYTLRGVNPQGDLRGSGAGIDGALDILKDTKGLNISVTVSVGQAKRDKGLAPSTIKKLASKLMTEERVSLLKLKGREGVDDSIDEIDLLNDRIMEYHSIQENGRYIDTADCLKSFSDAFSRKRQYIKDHLEHVI